MEFETRYKLLQSWDAWNCLKLRIEPMRVQVQSGRPDELVVSIRNQGDLSGTYQYHAMPTIVLDMISIRAELTNERSLAAPQTKRSEMHSLSHIEASLEAKILSEFVSLSLRPLFRRIALGRNQEEEKHGENFDDSKTKKALKLKFLTVAFVAAQHAKAVRKQVTKARSMKDFNHNWRYFEEHVDYIMDLGLVIPEMKLLSVDVSRFRTQMYFPGIAPYKDGVSIEYFLQPEIAMPIWPAQGMMIEKVDAVIKNGASDRLLIGFKTAYDDIIVEVSPEFVQHSVFWNLAQKIFKKYGRILEEQKLARKRHNQEVKISLAKTRSEESKREEHRGSQKRNAVLANKKPLLSKSAMKRAKTVTWKIPVTN